MTRNQIADRCPDCGRVKVLTHKSLKQLVELHTAEIRGHAKTCSRKAEKRALAA